MKILIWIAVFFIHGLITTWINRMGIILGAIPTMILFAIAMFSASKLCKAYDASKEEKKEIAELPQQTKETSPVTTSTNEKSDKSPVNMESTAKSICDFLWAQAFSFMREANVPRTAYNITFFWSVFYYSIADILEQEDVNDLVLREFVLSSSRVLHIPPYEVEQLATIKKLRDATLKTLFEVRPNPATAYGISQILESSLVLRFPDGNEPEEAKPTPTDIAELMSTIVDVTQYVCQIFRPSAVTSAPSPSQSPIIPKPVPNSAPTKNYAPAIVVLFLIVILFGSGVLAFGGSLENSSQNSKNEAAEQIIKVVDPYNSSEDVAFPEEPKTKPASGRLLEYPIQRRLAPLVIEPGNAGFDYIVSLKSTSNSTNDMSFYVRSGERTEMSIPIGEYTVSYSYGTTWYGNDFLFGPNSGREIFLDTFSFTEVRETYTKIVYHGWEINLQTFNESKNNNHHSPIVKPIETSKAVTAPRGTFDSNAPIVRDTLNPVPKPVTGSILSGTRLSYGTTITVTASSGHSCVVSLKNANDEERLSFFVRAGETAKVFVPAERLRVYFASGSTWYGYGKGLMFGANTVYTKDSDLLDFTNYSWEYTLYPITNGNFTESPSSENEFF